MDNSSSIFTKAFWKGAGERAVKTVIQTFCVLSLSALGLSQTPTGEQLIAAAQHISGNAILTAFLASLLAGVASIATSCLSPSFVAGAAVAPAADVAAELVSHLPARMAEEPEPGTVPAVEAGESQ